MDNVMSRRENCPYLSSLLAVSFLQDGVTSWELPDVAQAFVSTRWSYGVAGVRADIKCFLHEHGNEVDEAFVRILPLSVDPQGYGMSTAEWLHKLDACLAEAAEAISGAPHPS